MTIKEIEIQLALGSLTDDIKLKLADNRKTSKKILIMLSIDENWRVRSYVAENPNTPKKALTKLSTDEVWFVRCYVVFNPNYTRTTDLEDSRP